MTSTFRTVALVATFALLSVLPALAQGNGKAKGNGDDRARSAEVRRERPTLQRRGAEALRLPRGDDRYDRRNRRDASLEDILFGRDRNGRTNIPPGWCNGRGNPHNTPQNCGYASNRRYDWDANDRYGGYGSYSRAHDAFHRALDSEYAERASQRRSDPLFQLQLRAWKSADHDRWHDRMGRRH